MTKETFTRDEVWAIVETVREMTQFEYAEWEIHERLKKEHKLET